MWKKDDAASEPASKGRETETPTGGRSRMRESSQSAAIGRSITIKGEVSGDEDLLIEGHVDGTVNLKQHSVTIGGDGRVEANVTARLITVEGRVEGNLTAHEQVVLRASARVEGDIAAPRVVLEDGARFRGGVDMGDLSERNEAQGSGSRGSSPGAGSSSGSGSSASKSGESGSSAKGSGSGKEASQGAKGVTA